MNLFSIGYATKALREFIEQLQQYAIDVVVDVRSVPYSAAFHDYHRENLQAALSLAGIRYLYLGDELGPRSKDPAHYDDCGQVQFERLMTADLFKEGIERLENGLAKGFGIALMCAEKDPATCHRSLLIGYYLQRQCDVALKHIRHDGSLESQAELEERFGRAAGFATRFARRSTGGE